MKLDSPEALEARLREIGAERYHNNHRFHALMRDGALTRGQVQAWALNRYCYQSRIPIKDSALMSRMVDHDLRREWSQRVIDHDGTREGQGGIAKWLHLCERLGLDRERVLAEEGVLPATPPSRSTPTSTSCASARCSRPLRRRSRSCSRPAIIGERTSAMLSRYDFIDEDTLTYFTARLTQAPRDADFALDYVKRNATSPELRETVCNGRSCSRPTSCGRSSMRSTSRTSPRAFPLRAPSCPARARKADSPAPSPPAVPARDMSRTHRRSSVVRCPRDRAAGCEAFRRGLPRERRFARRRIRCRRRSQRPHRSRSRPRTR